MSTVPLNTPEPAKAAPPEVSCAGGCGLKSAEPEQIGWELLPITGRYRCGACTRALSAVSKTKEQS